MTREGIEPLAVDADRNALFVLQEADGRDALVPDRARRYQGQERDRQERLASTSTASSVSAEASE